jgi:predicted metal-binding protein
MNTKKRIGTPTGDPATNPSPVQRRILELMAQGRTWESVTYAVAGAIYIPLVHAGLVVQTTAEVPCGHCAGRGRVNRTVTAISEQGKALAARFCSCTSVGRPSKSCKLCGGSGVRQ